MKEFSLPINLFQMGLRKKSLRQLNVPELSSCYGYKLSEVGLEIPDTVVNPFTASEADFDWPFPQIFRFTNATYLLTRHYIYSVDANWALTTLAAWFHSGDCWDGIDYQDFVLFTNGTVILMNDPTSGDFRHASTVDFPTCKTFCDMNGQVIIGNTALGTNVIQWSNIGTIEFATGKSNESGYYSVPWDGEVFRIKRLGNSAIVYGDNGILVMTPVSSPAPTYRFTPIASYGIAGRGAVGGDESRHVFVDEKGYLRQLTADYKITNLDYSEFFAPLLGTTIGIEFNSEQDEYYISNNVRSFLLTQKGLTEIPYVLAGGEVFDGEFVSVFRTDSTAYRTIVSNPFDMALRSGKTIVQVAVGTSTPRQTQIAIDWRNDISSSFTRSPFFVLNDEGIADCPVAGVEFRLVVRTPIAYTPDLNGRAMVNWKLTDKRTIRGVYVPAQDNG
jgi:hypothetical protein